MTAAKRRAIDGLRHVQMLVPKHEETVRDLQVQQQRLGEALDRASLLVLILRRLSIPGASLAGFAFALHPVCVEAVAWISEQKTVFSAAVSLML